MRTSVASLLMCQNETRFMYTRISDSTYNIKSSEYIHAVLEISDPPTTVYTIGILFGRSFKKDMSGRRLAVVAAPNVLTLKIGYNDSTPAASETELETGLWGGSVLSVDRIFHDSSFGQVQFDRDASLVASIRLNQSIESTRLSPDDGCDTSAVLQSAGQAAFNMGIDTRLFTHVEYILPSDFGSTCDSVTGSSMSAIGCYVPGGMSDECFVILRSGSVFSRARGFGHNFGLLRAGGCALVPGVCSVSDAVNFSDASAIMGASNTVLGLGGFIAPNRIKMGWLDRVSHVSGDGQFAIGALAVWPSVNDGALIVPCNCPLHSSMGDSCITVVSYRSPTGIDENITDIFRHSVSVHLASATGHSETALLVSLYEGESYLLASGKVVFVCETGRDRAVVAIGGTASKWVDVCVHREPVATTVIVCVVAFVVLVAFASLVIRYCRRTSV